MIGGWRTRAAAVPPASEAARRSDAEGGFTLVEAIVAFMIVAIVLIMGLKVLVNGATAAHTSPQVAERYEEAASLLDGLLADPRLRPGMREGRFADGQPWRIQVDDVTASVVPGSSAPLLKVALYDGAQVVGRPMVSTFILGRQF